MFLCPLPATVDSPPPGGMEPVYIWRAILNFHNIPWGSSYIIEHDTKISDVMAAPDLFCRGVWCQMMVMTTR